jgi:hypothetical protein
MKKLLLAFALTLTTGLALADYVVIEGGHGTTPGNTSGSTDTFFKYNHTINNNLAVDVESLTVQITNTGASTHTVQERVETGLIGKIPLGSATLQGRVSYGEKLSSTNYFYYTYAPAFVVPVGNTGLSVKAEYRWRKSVTNNLEDTRISRISTWYDLDKNNSIGYRFDHYTGTSPQNINSIFYQRSF